MLVNASAKTLCTELNIGVNTVYDIKNRSSYPRVDTLFKIASGLGCSLEELCTVNTEDEEEGEEA